jgi:hypothetical protein
MHSYIDYDKEVNDYLALSYILRDSGWVDSDVILVNCYPDYSSSLTQFLNHKLSDLNRNELFESITLEIPDPLLSQVWNRDTREYQAFDKYILEWTSKHISSGYKYLFLCTVTQERWMHKIVSAVKAKTDVFRFATVYHKKAAFFKPDYYVEEHDGGIYFRWQNRANPNYVTRQSKTTP